MQRWNIIRHELMPELRNAVGALTPKLVQVVRILEWVRIEEFVSSSWGGCGRPEHDRGMLASAFVAKAVLGISTTAGLIERLAVDRAPRRICGFSMWKKLPSEAQRYKERSQAERTNARLKDDYGGRNVRVRGGEKVMSHLMFGMLALTAEQLMRLLT